MVMRCLRSSRTGSLVFLLAPRVTARACIVRARSRVSGNAVHVLGRRGRVMRSDRRLHSEPINLRATLCLVCSRRRSLADLHRKTSLVTAEACASCSPRAAFRRATPSRPRTEERSPKGSGPVDGSEIGGTRVSRRADRWVNRPRSRGDCSSFHELGATAPWMSLSPPPARAAIGHRSFAFSGGRRGRFHALPRER